MHNEGTERKHQHFQKKNIIKKKEWKKKEKKKLIKLNISDCPTKVKEIRQLEQISVCLPAPSYHPATI